MLPMRRDYNNIIYRLKGDYIMKNFRIIAVSILLFLTIAGYFAIVVSASADSNVVYLSGSGLDTNNGLSPESPVCSLSRAVELLNNEGGTIVLCGDLQESTGITFPVQSNKLYLTSCFGGVDYDATLSFGSSQNQANKNIVFQSDAEISCINLNYNLISSVTNTLLTIYSGPSLTIGNDVVTSHTDESGNIDYDETKIAIRGGTNKCDSDVVAFSINSGCYRYVLAGNNVGNISTSNIQIGGCTNVYEFVQCGGIGKTVTNVNLEIVGGTIAELYVDGYNHSSANVNIIISDGIVKQVIDGRSSCASDVATLLSVTLYDQAASYIQSINVNGTHSGTKNFCVKNNHSSDEQNMPVFLSVNFSQWNNVKIEDRIVAYLNCEYSAPTGSISIEAGSKLILTEETILPSGLSNSDNVEIGSPVYFVDPIYGDDDNGGRSLPYPVKTWTQAVYAMNGKGGTLVLCGEVVAVSGSTATTTIQVDVPAQERTTKITSLFGGVNFGGSLVLGTEDNNSKIILCFTSDTIIDNTEILYSRPNGSGTSAEIWSGPSLVIGEGVNVAATGENNQITLRTGLYTESIAEAELSVMSGNWNYVQGGNSKYSVNESTLSFGGSAIAQYVQCGGTNTSIGTSNVTISGGTILNAMYINGYGSSAKPADIANSHITISGGEIVAIYDARNTYGEVIEASTISITETGADCIESLNLNYKNTISGTKTLCFDAAENVVVNYSFAQWDVVEVCNTSTVMLFNAYTEPATKLVVEQGSSLLLNAMYNDSIPTYQGAGSVNVTSTISREHSNYAETLYMALDNQKLADGTDVDKEQGMAIWGNELFVMQNNGVCKVYDLLAKSPTPIAIFNLGSYNEGSPTTDYSNHCNTAMFGSKYYVDPDTDAENTIPLLYVRTGNAATADEDGYIARLAIENIVRSETNGVVSYSAETLQTIIYNDYYDGNKTVSDYNATYGTSFVSPSGFGAPMWLVDDATNSIYILSAKYRTTYGSVGQTDIYPGYNSVADNYYVITKFDLPELSEGDVVTLTPLDIKDQFTTEFAAFSTQGGTLYSNQIIYTFGFGQVSALNPNKILVFDLQDQRISEQLELSNSMFAFDEIEACVVYNGVLLVNTQGGYVYEIKCS